MNKIYHYKHSLLYAKSATTLLLPFYKSVASSFHLCPYFQEYSKVSEANCFFPRAGRWICSVGSMCETEEVH